MCRFCANTTLFIICRALASVDFSICEWFQSQSSTGTETPGTSFWTVNFIFRMLLSPEVVSSFQDFIDFHLGRIAINKFVHVKRRKQKLHVPQVL